MSEVKQSPFSLSQFHVEEFFIKRNPVPPGTPDFNVTPQGLINRSKGSFLLILEVSVKDTEGAYDIRFTSVASFLFKKDEAEGIYISNYFYLNAPAIVFPYIRSYIAGVTALSGLDAIHLPLMNFPKLIGEELKANTTYEDRSESEAGDRE